MLTYNLAMENSTLKKHIGYWITRLQTQVHKAFEQRLSCHGITVAEWCILISLFDKQATSVTTLASYIEVSKPVISRLIEQLNKKGLILTREGENRRNQKLMLTKKAKQLVPILSNEADCNDKKFFSCLNENELNNLKCILTKLFINSTTIIPSGWLLLETIMSSNQPILNIINKAKKEKWPFPKTFDALKNNGVVSYEVAWNNGYHSQFNLANDRQLIEDSLEGFTQPEIATQFSKTKAKESLTIHQQDKTSYLQWLYDMAAAGVSSYIVNMQDHTVTYFNPTQTESIIEHVPTL